ncbi:hypothetical protein ACIQMJ_32205 [Actinosynnema sp. NPDC091369]
MRQRPVQLPQGVHQLAGGAAGRHAESPRLDQLGELGDQRLHPVDQRLGGDGAGVGQDVGVEPPLADQAGQRGVGAGGGERDLGSQQRAGERLPQNVHSGFVERAVRQGTHAVVDVRPEVLVLQGEAPRPRGFTPHPRALRLVDRLRPGLQVEDGGVGVHRVVVQPVHDLGASAAARLAPPPEQLGHQPVGGPAELAERRPTSAAGARTSRGGASVRTRVSRDGLRRYRSGPATSSSRARTRSDDLRAVRRGMAGIGSSP